MKLTKDQVKHVAKLANLTLSEEEVEKFEEQLSETLDYVDTLEKIDTKDVEPTSQVTGLENVTREDVVTTSFSQGEALRNVKSSYKGYIKVKAILEQT